MKDEEHRQNDSQVDKEQQHTNIPQNLEGNFLHVNLLFI